VFLMIDPEIYADNDSDIEVADLPTGLTVEWGIVPLGPAGAPPGPTVALDVIDDAVSGTLTESGTPPVYRGTLEGAAITTHLVPTYDGEQVALVVRVGQDVRVYGLTTVRAARLANA
jgi:hypothetical protein